MSYEIEAVLPNSSGAKPLAYHVRYLPIPDQPIYQILVATFYGENAKAEAQWYINTKEEIQSAMNGDVLYKRPA